MAISFVTGSEDKFKEAKSVISDLIQVKLDLPEIQDISAEIVIEEKLRTAFDRMRSEVVVEDTSLYFDDWNGLPGPLVKWFLKTVGNQGLVKMLQPFGNTKATAKTVIGYTKDGANFQFFEGSLRGIIVEPRGENGFGWDSIFQELNSGKTFAEMTKEEKNACSMRRIAFESLSARLQMV